MDFNEEYVGQEPDGPVPRRPRAVPDYHSGRRPDYLKLSPTQIKAALKCPALYHYRYVEKLESLKTPSVLAFGKAVHEAIAAAYARRNAPMTPEEVADVAEHCLRVADKNGISYKDGEALDTREETKTVRGKETVVVVAGLVEEARRLVSVWWLQCKDAVLAAGDPVCEVPLTYALDGETEFTCRVDVAEHDPRGGLTLGDHKTASGWGPSDEQEAAQSIQMWLECWLWWKVKGVVPAGFYFTVLKKTKTPEVFRYYVKPPTAEELVAFEDQLRGYAAVARAHKALGRPVKYVQRDCGWCSFSPLCWKLDGAEAMFTTREARRRQTEPEESEA